VYKVIYIMLRNYTINSLHSR